MRKGIEGADVVLAVVSPDYIKSKNCGYEMKIAAESNMEIIPIIYGLPFSAWPPKQIGGMFVCKF